MESSLANNINYIKSTFNLTDKELKQIICGENLKNNTAINLDKTFKLYCLAKNWVELGFPNNRGLIFRKIMKIESVFEIMLKEINEEKALFTTLNRKATRFSYVDIRFS